MESKKLSKQKEAEVRAQLYKAIEQGLEGIYINEPVVKGRLITVPVDGTDYYATVNVTLHNPEKFDVEEARHEYVTKLEAAAQRIAERAEKARLKAEKAEKKNQQ
jgi:ribosome-binding factor A